MVADVAKRRVEIGFDCVGDGEYWSVLNVKWFDQRMTGLGTRPMKPGEVGSMRESTRGSIIAAQPSAIGYFAKIASTRLHAFSAATCGDTSFFMISAQAACHTCSFWTWA